MNEDEAAGKSDAFFFFSEDGRYCVKSVKPKEAAKSARILRLQGNVI